MSEESSEVKPKGRMTPYAYYLKTSWEEHKAKSNETTEYAEFAKECSEKWKTISVEEKQKFIDLAEEDILRYEKECQNYRPPRFGKDRLRPRPYDLDPKTPHRPMSAFFWFCQDMKPKVEEENPGDSFGEIAKKLGQLWIQIDSESKAKYEALQVEDQARYDREMAAYKKPITTPGSEKKT